MKSQEKLCELNKLKVIDWSCSAGEIEYVCIANTEENREALKQIGMTYEEMIDAAGNDEGVLDITNFAFYTLGADWYWHEKGFGIEE